MISCLENHQPHFLLVLQARNKIEFLSIILNSLEIADFFQCFILSKKALTSDSFETHYTHVFWGSDYEHDDEKSRKFYFQGET